MNKKTYTSPRVQTMHFHTEGMLAASTTSFGTSASSTEVDKSSRSAKKIWDSNYLE